MNETVFDSIEKIIKDKFDNSQLAFTKHVGISNSTLQSTLRNRKNISVNILLAIKEKFPEIDLNNFLGYPPEGVMPYAYMEPASSVVQESSAAYEAKTLEDITKVISELTLKVKIVE